MTVQVTHDRRLVSQYQVPIPGEESGQKRSLLVGSSAPMRDLFDMIDKLSLTEQPVLIIGETGTGKELVAHSIHEGGLLSGTPFLAVDCGALSPRAINIDLFECFLERKSAAVRTPPGRCSGTVFLDTFELLPKKSRGHRRHVLRRGSFFSVRYGHRVKFDARIIVATHHDLLDDSRKGNCGDNILRLLNPATVRV